MLIQKKNWNEMKIRKQNTEKRLNLKEKLHKKNELNTTILRYLNPWKEIKYFNNIYKKKGKQYYNTGVKRP